MTEGFGDLYATVAKIGTEVRLPEGNLLWQEGDPGDYVTFLLDGQLEVIHEEGSGEVVVLRVLEPGSVVGEIAIVDGRTRSAAVRAATACRVLRIGALEFKQMLSDRPDVLQALFWLQVERVRSLTHLVNRSHHRAITDQLTRLYNFGFFRERLDAELERARATSDAVSLAMFDIDHFKAYNDRNGHQEGNAALVVVSSLLRAEGRRGGVIARYGGEEFVALLYATDRDETISYAERVRVAVEAHVFPGGASQPGGRLTISAGVATFPEDAGDDEALIAAADRSLYDAKAGGRNRVVSVATRPVRCPVRPAFGSLCLARIPYGVRMEAQVSQPIEVPAFPGPAPSGSFYGEPPVAEPSVDFVNAS